MIDVTAMVEAGCAAASQFWKQRALRKQAVRAALLAALPALVEAMVEASKLGVIAMDAEAARIAAALEVR